MRFVLHLLVFFCFSKCLCITKRSARLICVSKSVEGPDVPLQNTKTKASPDNYSKAPGLEVPMYTYTNRYAQTGFISIFVVFLSLSFHSQQGPQLLLACTPLTSSYRCRLRSTGTALLGLPSSCSLSNRFAAFSSTETGLISTESQECGKPGVSGDRRCSGAWLLHCSYPLSALQGPNSPTDPLSFTPQ